MKRQHQIILAAALFALASCQAPENPAKPDTDAPFSIQVNDTDFSKGRLGYRQEVVFEDLVKLHGHRSIGSSLSAMIFLKPISSIKTLGRVPQTNKNT